MEAILDSSVKFSTAGKSKEQIKDLMKFRKENAKITEVFWLSKKACPEETEFLARKAMVVVILN